MDMYVLQLTSFMLILVNMQHCLTIGSCPGTVAVVVFAHGHLKYGWKGHSQGMSQSPDRN